MKKYLLLSLFLIASSAMAADMRFVQVTDVRYTKANEDCVLHKVIKDINRQKDVEFVVFTGDNINQPSKTDLEDFLSEAKKLNCPFYIVIGDHDVNKYKGLSKYEFFKTVKKNIKKHKFETPNYSFEKDGVVFIVADGSKEVIPGTNGFYKEDTLQWIENELKRHPDKHIIILQHFPLIPPCNKEMYATFKPEPYLKLLSEHKNVKAVISGHFGINKELQVNGITHISTAPAPYYRIIDLMDYETSNPTIWAQLKEVR